MISTVGVLPDSKTANNEHGFAGETSSKAPVHEEKNNAM
jgi:hypothetical protein